MIGLVDYLFAPDEIDNKILALIRDGKMVSKKGKKDEDLPQEFRQIKDMFERIFQMKSIRNYSATH